MNTVVQGVNPLGEFFLLSLDKELYSREAIMKTIYAFTEDYFIHAAKTAGLTIGVYFYNKNENSNEHHINLVVKQFLHQLHENQLRQIIHQETAVMHQEIVKKAFSSAAPLLDAESQNDPISILTSAV